MYELLPDGQILAVEQVGPHRIGTHYTWATHIHATYDPTTSTLCAEYRHPVIEGTEWQGQLLDTEQRPMLLSVDGSDPIELPVTNGVAQEVLEFEAPGTYTIRVSAAFGCEPALLEVVVP